MTAQWRGTAIRSAQLGGDPTVDISGLGIIDGDQLVAIAAASAGATITMDAAWTLRGESLGTNLRIWTRTASSEPASYTLTVPGATAASLISISAFYGQHASTPIDFITAVSNTVATLVIPQGTSLGANRLLAQMLVKGNGGTFTPPGPPPTERYDTLSATQNFVHAGGDEIVGSGATGSRTWTASIASGIGFGVMVALAPAPPKEGTFTGTYDFTGTGFTGEEGPGEGSFTGGYDFAGGPFVGEAPGISSGAFTGGYDFAGAFTGQAPNPTGLGDIYPGGRDRFTARRTPKNRRRYG